MWHPWNAEKQKHINQLGMKQLEIKQFILSDTVDTQAQKAEVHGNEMLGFFVLFCFKWKIIIGNVALFGYTYQKSNSPLEARTQEALGPGTAKSGILPQGVQ